jgi:4-amino-4-deoxy-L-arabinose transferase-like glycosyltransferase
MRDVRTERPRLPADAIALGLLLVVGALVVCYLRGYLSRPLWFDEQWRAYHVTARGLGFELRTIYAPAALGWLLLEKASVSLLGSHEVALRAPMALVVVALPPATYWLARRWLGRVASALTAGTLLLNGAVLGYGLQLKPFITDALVAVAMLGVWTAIHGAARWRPVGYAALGLLTLCSIAALFVLVPLLVFDLVVAVRARRLLPGLALAALAGVPALAHLVLFVRPQTLLLSYSYWQRHFVPHRPGAAAGFLAERLASYLPRLLTGAALQADNRINAPFLHALPAWLAVPAAVAGVAALALGARALLRTTSGRGLLVATGGALALQAMASWAGLWPFGFVRVNVFLVPLLWVVMGVGVADALAGRAGGAPLGAVLRGTGAVILAMLTAVAVVDARAVRSFELRAATVHPLDGDLRAAVAAARNAAGAGALAIVNLDGHLGFGPYGKGWVYYMDRYDGNGDGFERLPAIPPGDTLFLTDEHPEAARPFLTAHPAATRVVVYMSHGVSRRVGRTIRDSLAEAGFAMLHATEFPLSGRVSLWSREPARATTRA